MRVGGLEIKINDHHDVQSLNKSIEKTYNISF